MKKRPKTKWRFVSAKDLTAAVAYWAVRLSPYECPHNLVDAVRALSHRAEAMVMTKPIHRRFGFAKKTEKQIKQMVEALVHGTAEVQVWNRCRKGKTPDIIATSIYWGKPHPDRDFIDLHALVLEIMSDFRKEWALEDQGNLEMAQRILVRAGKNKTSTKSCCPVAPPQDTPKRFLKKVLA